MSALLGAPGVRVEALTPSVWVAYVAPAALTPDGIWRARALGWLDADERRALARRRHVPSGQACLAAHLLRRALLSELAGPPPAAWRFARQARGRPVAHLGDLGRPGPAVSIAYRPEMAACAVADGALVGVDVEARWPGEGAFAAGHAPWSAKEAAHLGALSPAARHQACLRLWTLKEAYLKALGVGLGPPLGQLCATLTAGGAALRVGGTPLSSWRFWQRQAAATTWLSVAAWPFFGSPPAVAPPGGAGPRLRPPGAPGRGGARGQGAGHDAPGP